MKHETGIQTGPLADGTQVVAHDACDVETFVQATEAFPRLARTVEESAQQLITAPALLRDLFWGFHKRAPQLAPVVPLTPAHEVNQQILAEVFTTREWQELRTSGTVGDGLNSTLATIGVSEQVIGALDEATLQYVKQLHTLSEEVAALFAQAELWQAEAEIETNETQAVELRRQAAAARQKAQSAVSEPARIAQELAAGMNRCERQMRLAARQGMQAVAQEIEEMQQAMNAFGAMGAPDWGMESGTNRLAPLQVKEKLALAQTVRQSKRLQQIAAVCGRFKRIALERQRTRVIQGAEEVTSITTGRDLARLLPSELALLAEPALEDLFLLRYAEGALLQYELQGREPEGRGPIILALDESGSMEEECGGMTKEVWSKAVMLGLLAIARLQKRDFAVLHFSGARDLRTDIFPQGQATSAEVIACASHFFNGGTIFDEWMNEALRLVGAAQFNRADVICVSDGVAGVRDETLAAWEKIRAERGLRTYSVLLGTEDGEAFLRQFSDAVFSLAALTDDLPALETLFSIGGTV